MELKHKWGMATEHMLERLKGLREERVRVEKEVVEFVRELEKKEEKEKEKQEGECLEREEGEGSMN